LKLIVSQIRWLTQLSLPSKDDALGR